MSTAYTEALQALARCEAEGSLLEKKMQYTGTGCDVCGYGSVEDVDAFDPTKPCPDCGEVMIPEKEESKE